MRVVDYVIISLISLLIILLVVVLVRQNKKNDPKSNDIEIEKIKEELTKLITDGNSTIQQNLSANNQASIKLQGDMILQIVDRLNKLSKDQAQTQSDQQISILNRLKSQSEESMKHLNEFERAINTHLESRMDALNLKLDKKMEEMDGKVSNSLTTGFSKTNEIYTQLVERLTKINEAENNLNKLSEDVVSLKSVLENNQNRGKFGEFTLERILFGVFGDAKVGVYATQYNLSGIGSTERPDAVIFLPEPYNLLCIDSKFPYQDYKRLLELKDETYKKSFAQSVRKHITDIESKYVIKNKTAPEAIMFIPSDAIFGYINGELYDIVEFARAHNVILTSPSTLQPIIANLNLLKINYIRNENLEIISAQIKLLGRDFLKFKDDWARISKNISQLHNATDDFDKRVELLNKKFDRIDQSSLVEAPKEKEPENF